MIADLALTYLKIADLALILLKIANFTLIFLKIADLALMFLEMRADLSLIFLKMRADLAYRTLFQKGISANSIQLIQKRVDAFMIGILKIFLPME